MATIFYGLLGNIDKKIDRWINIAGIPDVLTGKEEELTRFSGKLLDKYDVIPFEEALERYPDADVWVTYRRANITAAMLLTKLPPERIHFLEADLEYRKGCRFLGKFISYRKDSFSPCCVTGVCPIVPTSGTIEQRLSQWKEYTTDLIDKIRNEQPNACQACRLLTYGFWQKTVKLNEINLGSNQPGDVCNFRCTYCFCEPVFKRLKNSKDGLTTYEILEQLHQMPEFDHDQFTVQLANGEFCVNKRCDDMLDILLKNNWKIILISNLSIYKEKLADLMNEGRITRLLVSLDAGTRETFQKIKLVDGFDKVVENFKKYPVNQTKFIVKYIFVEGVNDNEADIDGYYEIVKEAGGIIMFSADMSKPFTAGMRELVLRVLKRAVQDGVQVSTGSSYLAPQDIKFIKANYAC